MMRYKYKNTVKLISLQIPVLYDFLGITNEINEIFDFMLLTRELKQKLLGTLMLGPQTLSFDA